jgi:hypothetical protein
VVEEIHHDPNAFRTNGEIDCSSDTRSVCARDAPVGEVTVLSHLKSSHHSEVKVSAANEGKRVTVVDECRAFDNCYGLFARVYQIAISEFFLSKVTDTNDSVLAVEDDFVLRVDDIGDSRRHSDTEVYEPTVGNIGG